MISNSNFVLNVIPEYSPFNPERLKWWKQQKQYCFEGKWSGGKWMAPELYFYVNFWHILVNKTVNSKSKTLGRPFLRDLDWEKSYIYQEAKGFSGFADDKEDTCLRSMHPLQLVITKQLYPDVYEKYKNHRFVPARDYLRRIHTKGSLGKPLYENQAMNIIDIEARGCLLKGTKVIKSDGTLIKVEDVKQGDTLLGKDGTIRNVQWVHNGISNMYKISSPRFADVIVNENHRVSVIYKKFKRQVKGSNTTDVETSFTIKELLEKQKQSSFRNRYYRYKISTPVEFHNKENKKVTIDPYYLGLWLSDGRSNSTSIHVTDKVLWKYLHSFSLVNSLETTIKTTEHCPVFNWKESKEFYIKNSIFREEFKKLNLINNKHIPITHKLSSIENRFKLLAGLIDGDGCYDKAADHYRIYCGTNKSIAEDTSFIARSLGFYSSYALRKRKDFKDTWEVLISGDIDKIPVKIERKKPHNTKKRINVTTSSFKIEYENQDEFYGFHLDGDNEYLLEDFTVDHNTGKSYFASGIIGHNFMTDGATDYEDYLAKFRAKEFYSSETVVGAYDTKYSKDLLTKVKLGLSTYPGSTKFNGRFYPSPLHKGFSGSWEASKTITQEVDVKEGGQWVKQGTRSKIQHRTFKDNPFAANGTRPNISFIDEVGFMANLIDTLGAMKESSGDGDIKFGLIWGMGTGGDMEGGSTEQAKEVFYNTEDFDCLSFDDIYEGKGKIGLFIPSHEGFNEFRNEEGILDKDRARKVNEIRREKARKATSKKIYASELQNRPEKPSEAFHSEQENVLDIPMLEDHLRDLESRQNDIKVKGIYGNLIINGTGKVEFVPDLKNKLRPAPFPIKKGKQPDGCVVIWELPEEGDIPFGMYIAATDPYDQDQAANTTSVGSTLVMKRFTKDGIVCKRIVAEFSGRPPLARQHHETVRRLLLYYNARDLYENERNTIKMHFEQKNCAYLLADTPDIIRTQTNDKTVKTGKGRGNKGIGMPPKQQDELIFFVKEYLETPIPNGDGSLYLHSINSIPLIQECIAYNSKYGNYDRMIAFMLLILFDNQMYRVRAKQTKEDKEVDSFFRNFRANLLANNKDFQYNEGKESYAQTVSKGDKKPLLPNMF